MLRRVLPAVLFFLVLPSTDATADTYPRQPGVDAIHYVFGLTITDTGPFVRVAVCDQGLGFDPARSDWRGHRGGLFLLDTLAYDWGIERNAAGTEVWFEI